MYIDGTRFGNVSRFLNHSCDPNVKVHEILADHHDSTYPRVGFFAAREIEAGEELCWAYASTIGGAVLEKHDRSDCKCLCGSEKCKGYLPS